MNKKSQIDTTEAIFQHLMENVAPVVPEGHSDLVQQIANRFASRFSAKIQAEEWVLKAPIPGFGTKTAYALIKEGHADWVISFLDGVEAGVHA